MLSSLNTVTKESAKVAMILGWASPDPGVGLQVELSGRHASSLFDLFGIGKTLASERIAAEEPPPALLQIEPARPGRNEHLMEARMIDKRGARLEAGMTTEIVGDDEQVAFGVVGFAVGEQGDVAFRVARSRASGQFLPITYPQRSIDPGLLRPTPVIHGGFVAMAIR